MGITYNNEILEIKSENDCIRCWCQPNILQGMYQVMQETTKAPMLDLQLESNAKFAELYKELYTEKSNASSMRVVLKAIGSRLCLNTDDENDRNIWIWVGYMHDVDADTALFRFDYAPVCEPVYTPTPLYVEVPKSQFM